MALLAAFGFAGQSRLPQQKQSPVTQQSGVQPTEQITVEPVLFAWDDLVKVQAQLPKSRTIKEQVFTPDSPDQPLQPVAQAHIPEEFMPLPEGGVQKALCAGFATEPSMSKHFDAQLDVPDTAGFSFIPPDVTGSVGPNHLMVMLNNKVLIQDRLGGTVASVDTSVFWSPLGATPLSPTNTFHRVNYDSIDGRWLATCKNGPAATATIFFAISATNDPTGVWNYYSFLSDPTAVQFADWIMQGYNQTWIVISADMAVVATGLLVTPSAPKLWAIDKATALAGGPITISTFATGYFRTTCGTGTSSRLAVSRAFDASDTSVYMVGGSTSTDGTNLIHQIVRLNGTGPAPVAAPFGPSLFAPPATASFYQIAPVSISSGLILMNQSGEARTLNPFSIRMGGAVVRNGSLWLVQSGGSPGPVAATPTSTAVAWYQINPAAMPTPVVQGGVFTTGAGTASMIPSIAVNCGNDVIIGFSNGDSTRFARAGYAMRLGTDPLNTMGPIRELKAGESTYWKNFGVGSTTNCVWGRWSAATVDPLDDKTLWTCQQYADQRVGAADNDSRWGTHWGRIGSCGTPTTTTPSPVTVCTGDPATFSTVATPFVAPVAYQWRKNGVDIPGATSSSFSIPSTVGADGGTYDVVVEDGCGSFTSGGALLDFGGAVVTTHPVGQTVAVGGTATFTVAGTGTGPLTYEWRKNGVSIVPLESNATLVLTGVNHFDIGNYDCIVSDVCGPSISNAALLKIGSEHGNLKNAAPNLQIRQQPKSATACVGTVHTLKVTAYGGNVTYVWRKGGVPIVPAETNSTLVLSPVAQADEASYDVVVSDLSSSITSAPAVLTVDDPIAITGQPTNQSAHLGDHVIYTVTATGDGEITYQWKKGGLIGPLFNMPGEEESTLDIPSVRNGDAGRYQCVVTNHCGSVASNTAKLTLLF